MPGFVRDKCPRCGSIDTSLYSCDYGMGGWSKCYHCDVYGYAFPCSQEASDSHKAVSRENAARWLERNSPDPEPTDM